MLSTLAICILLGQINPPQPPAFPFTADEAKRYQRTYADWAKLPVEWTHPSGITFVLVPPGRFLMGSPEDEPGRNPGGYIEGPRHEVLLTKPFYLSKNETTHRQFARFVSATNYKTDGERTGGGNAHDDKGEWKHRPGTHWSKPGFAGPFELQGDHPVVHVSHTDASAFCKWLAAQTPAGDRFGHQYGLPTEAQWEWACRAGSGDAYWWGRKEDDTGKVANVCDRTLKKVHPDWPRIAMPMDDGHAFLAPVASYRPNAFGLHDMLGNVWEFCSTRYGDYPKGPVVDPTAGDEKRGFAVRGGGWSNAPRDVRCATRNADPPNFCHSNLGFRVALQIGDPFEKSPVKPPAKTSADEVLKGLRDFYQKTARPDGSFQPGVDPEYRGMSDAAYSDLAAVTYAVVLHKTFGWKLPYEEKTREFLLSRQKPSGEFVNVAGTVGPDSPEGKTYNTTQGLVALHALGMKPKHDPLPIFEAILKEDYKQLPAYSTSFFPLAYLCVGRPIPDKADSGIRALMVQDETGYTNDHVAATFHASHYYRLVGEATPRSKEMVARVLRDQNRNGGWLLNMPGRDRHATFDAVFTLAHEGGDAPECRAAIARAADWIFTCRNPDGGFGHYPGSTSDADAIYFHIGALVIAGALKPAEPLPKDPDLLSWGHLMPVLKHRPAAPRLSLQVPGWVAGVAIDQGRLAAASSDSKARIFDVKTGQETATLQGHDDAVAAIQLRGTLALTGSYDHTAALWNAGSGKLLHRLHGHRGAVMAVAFSPDGSTLATAGIDGAIKLWSAADGSLKTTLTGHKSWVNSLGFHPQGTWLASGSSDGTIRIWSPKTNQTIQTIAATNAEVRSIAISPDGARLAAGLRFGSVKTWETTNWKQELAIPGQGDMVAVAFASPKRLVASQGDWNRGGIVRVFDENGEQVARLPHTGEILSIAVDGDMLVAGAADKTVRVWPTPR